jgi:hypothetical protein
MKREGGELAMKRLRVEERGGRASPTLSVETKECVEVRLQTLRIGGETVRHVSELGQFAWKATGLLAEVAPTCPHELVPRAVSEAKHRARLAVQGSSAGHVPEALIAGNLLGEKHEAPQRNGVQCLRYADVDRTVRQRRAYRPELVTRSVTNEAQYWDPTLPPLVQGHDRYQVAAGTGEPDQLTVRLPVMKPPREEPLPRRKDVPGSLGEAPPVRRLHRLERGCKRDVQRATRVGARAS